MAASNNKTTTTTNPAESRRTFLKIGGGVVVGAAVASIVEIPYYSNANNANASKVTSLQEQLAAANSNLSTVKGQYTTAQTQVSSLTSQLNTANTSLSTANASLTSTKASLSTANTQITTLTNNLATTSSQLATEKQTATTAQAMASTLQVQIDTTTGFLSLNSSEQSLVEAIVETIIPSDSSGPGAKEAGAIYFIDRQLASDYGRSGNMFMDGPWIQANTKTAVTVAGVIYPGGTANVRVGAGTRYQYMWNMREFWRIGLAALETYANSAYGGNFASLSAANQLTCLQDLWANKPTQASFSDILPSDFAYELTFLAWSGYLMDPLYGGNIGMVGWLYTGFNGVNMGNFYSEGHTTKELMVATTPTVLQPASLAQFEKGSP